MDISSAALNSLTDKSKAAETKAAQGYDQFLKLLTTQLQYQDPLDPMDSSEFTNQLVQFSQVEQAIISNQKQDALIALQATGQVGTAIGYIGKSIYYQGSNVYFDPTNTTSKMRIGYTMDSIPKTATMRILDADKNVIRAMPLPTGTSTGNMVWDGKDDQGNVVKAGVYTVQIDALSDTGKAVKGYTGVPATVLGVEQINGDIYLTLDGDRQVMASKILSVTTPDKAEVVTPTPEGGGGTDTSDNDTGGSGNTPDPEDPETT